jgi:adenylylsulfate kinase
MSSGFAIWITGLPASGKSSVAGELVRILRERRVPVVVLESDRLRDILTPEPTYREKERDLFYWQMVRIGALITGSGVNVIFDATANKRSFRDEARALIRRFVEIHLDCPLEVCTARDPKGIYARAAQEKASTVPGIQAVYEPPLTPDLRLDGRTAPPENAARVVEKLKQLLYI